MKPALYFRNRNTQTKRKEATKYIYSLFQNILLHYCTLKIQTIHQILKFPS